MQPPKSKTTRNFFSLNAPAFSTFGISNEMLISTVCVFVYVDVCVRVPTRVCTSVCISVYV